MKTAPIFVGLTIRAQIGELWQRTQTPEEHARWDLRFNTIEYLPLKDATAPQRFKYATRFGFGKTVAGLGETVGNRETNGTRTSALQFWSNDSRSLIRRGSGYWKYVLQDDHVRFHTQYDYSTRFGFAGQIFDHFLFRPVLSWATAWSFDCLRLWFEEDQIPEVSLRLSLVHALTRISLAIAWAYQGLVPKILFPETGERAILLQTINFSGYEDLILLLIGILQISMGFALIAFWQMRNLFLLNIFLLIVLTASAGLSSLELFAAPFNPFSLALAMIGLSLVGFSAATNLPSAANCDRHPTEG